MLVGVVVYYLFAYCTAGVILINLFCLFAYSIAILIYVVYGITNYHSLFTIHPSLHSILFYTICF